MQDYFSAERDPLQGRGTAVCGEWGLCRRRARSCTPTNRWPACRLPVRAAEQLRLVIAAAVTPAGDPLVAVRSELAGPRPRRAGPVAGRASAMGAAPGRTVRSCGFESPHPFAHWLWSAYHVHLYTLACVNRGPVPCKWDGGRVDVGGDERTWGLAEWVQEIRFTYLPLATVRTGSKRRRSDAALHADAARTACSNKHAASGTCRDCGFPETVLPWGHAEDLLLQEGETSGFPSPVGPADRSVWQVPSLQRLRGAIRRMNRGQEP